MRIKSTIIIFLILTLLNGCKEEIKLSNKNGGCLRMIKPTFHRTNFDPRKIELTEFLNSFDCAYESLTRISPTTLKTEPAIAESWSSNNNCTSFNFKLRKSIFFHHDNEQLTAHDVKFCFDKIGDTIKNNGAYDIMKTIIKGLEEFYNATKNGKTLQNGVSGVRVINDFEVAFDLISPNCEFPDIISRLNFAIYSKNSYNDKGIFKDNYINAAGPFQLKNASDSLYVFEKNLKYWRKDEKQCQLPYLDSIIYIHKIDSLNTMTSKIEAFDNHKLDIIPNVSAFNMSYLVKYEKFDQENYHSVIWDGHNLLTFNVSKPPFNNKNLRLAITHSMNKELLIDSIWQGENWYANYGLSLSYNFYNDTLFSLPFNPSLALEYEKKYLNEINKNQDTVYLLAIRNFDWLAQHTKRFINMNLQNIHVEVRLVESQDIAYNNMFVSDFEFVQHGYLKDIPSPSSSLSTYYGKLVPKSFEEQSIQNIARYKNATYDEYYNKAMSEKDPDKQANYFYLAEKLLIDSAVICPVYYYEKSYYANPKLKNFNYNSLDIIDFSVLYFNKNTSKAL